jgi:hypothetical protein
VQLVEPGKVAPQRLNEAAEEWDRTKVTTSIAVLEAFFVRFKDTSYAELARQRIDELKAGNVGEMEKKNSRELLRETEAYNKAVQENTSAAYRIFLVQYGNGKYSTEVAESLETCRMVDQPIEWRDAK